MFARLRLYGLVAHQRFDHRPYVAMEDAHSTILELDDREKNAFFAVYDGHGGKLNHRRIR